MVRLHPVRQSIVIVGISVALAVLACALPEDAYQRWKLLDGTIHANARWIYERCHFDPTPIDVAIVGPSRTGQGVAAPRLSRDLAERGEPANVVNFSLPESGRNINYLIVRELLETKRPKLIVLGVTEKPSRFGHSAFKYIAPVEMIVAPGYLTDANYLSDIVYLPFRQMWLFLEDIAPRLTGSSKTFDTRAYRGPSIDTTGSVVLPDGSIKEGERPASARELQRGVRKLEATNHPPLLPAAYADLEFGDERHYVRAIANLARAHGVKVVFLFLPYYTGTDRIQEQAFYERFGPVLNAGFLASHANLYADYGHLTRAGALALTDWLAAPIATTLRETGAERASGGGVKSTAGSRS